MIQKRRLQDRNYVARHITYYSFLLMYLSQISLSQAGSDPFAFFRPSVNITSSERSQLDQGSPIARVLQAKGLEVAMVAAVPVKVDGDRLVAWVRRIEEFKKGPTVLAVGRFSDPPRIEDLAGLELDAGDVSAIRSCRPRSCALKLSGREMTELQHAEAGNEGDSSAAVQEAFRHLVLARVQNYLATGQLPPDEDHREEVDPSSQFKALLDHTPFLTNRMPQLAKDLLHPSTTDSKVESFLYWSKEHMARRAVISVTQVSMVRSNDPGLPEALSVGRDIFSSHYIDASLSVTALMRGDPGGTNYLVYLNRTAVDVLHGLLGGMIRRSIQQRVKEAGNVLETSRQRLESGDPPGPVSNASGLALSRLREGVPIVP
jgi:hypothetical protein